MSAADNGLSSPDFTGFQSIFSSVDFIWAEFIFKRATAPAALRAAGWGGTALHRFTVGRYAAAWIKLSSLFAVFTARLGWS
jgi:hypothetical protein